MSSVDRCRWYRSLIVLILGVVTCYSTLAKAAVLSDRSTAFIRSAACSRVIRLSDEEQQRHSSSRLPQQRCGERLLVLQAAKAKGFGSSSGSSNSRSSRATNNSKTGSSSSSSNKSILRRVQTKYGGTTPQDIAKGTQRLFDERVQNLPSHIQLAIKLYQTLRQWDAKMSTMTILQQTSVPLSELDGAKRAQTELDRIYREHNICDIDIHNLLQQITWDVSADAKVARSITGTMPPDIVTRLSKACAYIVNATTNDGGRCLDVGCGFGTLVPILTTTADANNNNLQPSQIFGVDLSPEMIRHAMELYPECHFAAGDFLEYVGGPETDKDENGSDNGGYFDGIIFSSCLHDMPDPIAALHHAATKLLRHTPGSVLVIVHAQGAVHVQNQVAANPVLVRRALPTNDELLTFVNDVGDLRLIVSPAKANTPQDVNEGYLAVLQRT